MSKHGLAKDARANRALQLNPHHPACYLSRGVSPEAARLAAIQARGSTSGGKGEVGPSGDHGRQSGDPASERRPADGGTRDGNPFSREGGNWPTKVPNRHPSGRGRGNNPPQR